MTTSEKARLPIDQDSSGRSLGSEELENLRAAIVSGTLIATKGRFVGAFERTFAGVLGLTHAHACSSGTAAIHAAIAAIDPSPGDEVITSPITDMGAITPILYQGAIPVFADVDPASGNLTADSIRARLSERTRAIVVTHLFGNPCAMPQIAALAREWNVPIIEDCAQAYGARIDGRLVGTWGNLACFSLQQGKHITAGEGGIVATDDADLSRRARLFINKGWGYGDEQPDHYFLALNYRMNELTGAVALAQLNKLPALLRARHCAAEAILQGIAGLPGLQNVNVAPNSEPAYWRLALLVDEGMINGGAPALGQALAALGIPSTPHYIKKPAFDCEVIRQQRTFGRSHFPFDLARSEATDYSRHRFEGTYAFLRRVLVFGLNEKMGDRESDLIVDGTAAAIRSLAIT